VRFLAAWHHPAARQRAEAAVGTLTGAQLPPVPMADHRTAPEWVEDLGSRFRELGIDPEANQR
jgi:hypothetical protein